MARAGHDLAHLSPPPKTDGGFQPAPPQLSFNRVLEDHAHAAKLVADISFARLRQFYFYSDADNWSYENARGVYPSLKEAGHGMFLAALASFGCYASGARMEKKRKWLAAQMKAAPSRSPFLPPTISRRWMSLETCESPALPCRNRFPSLGGKLSAGPRLHATPISSVDTNLETLGLSRR